MNADEFKEFAKQAIDYIVDYTENIRERRVLGGVEPGYLHSLLPSEAPKEPQHWTEILPDFDRYIMPGVTHWHSPMFNAYYPAGSSYPSIVGEILSAGIGCIGINWLTSPSCTELEVIVLDWLAKMLGLPAHFLAASAGPGGGVLQNSGSEGVLVALLVAKDRKTLRLLQEDPRIEEGEVKARLVAYTSEEANSAMEKAAKLGSMRLRTLAADGRGRVCPQALSAAIREDRRSGLIPCFFMATLGTTGTCSFDDLQELGPICQREDVWLHVDAAYAGAAFICPEFQHYMAGIEYADSFNMNPHKWLLVNFDCSAFWIKDRSHLVKAFTVDRIYLKGGTDSHDKQAPEFRNWEISLGRRFRALKLWITLRLYGVSGLQSYIRKHCELAVQFAAHVSNDSRFVLVVPPSMGLVCFYLKGDSSLTKELLRRLTEGRELYLVAAISKDKYYLRYAINSRIMESSDVEKAWQIITKTTETILLPLKHKLSTTWEEALQQSVQESTKLEQ